MVISMVMPLTVNLEEYLAFSHITSSINISLLGFIEDFTKLLPIMYIFFLRYRGDKISLGDFIFVGGLSSLTFMIIENILYCRPSYPFELFKGDVSSYLDMSVNYSHFSSTILVFALVGITLLKCRHITSKILGSIFTIATLFYQALEHAFSNYVISRSVLMMIEYDKNSMFGYGLLHDILGKNLFTHLIVLTLIAYCYILDLKRFENISIKNIQYISLENILKDKKTRNKILIYLLGIMFLLGLCIFSLNYQKENSFLLFGLAGDWLFKLIGEYAGIIMAGAIMIAAASCGGAIGAGIAGILIPIALKFFSNSTLGKALENFWGEEKFNKFLGQMDVTFKWVGGFLGIASAEGYFIAISLIGLYFAVKDTSDQFKNPDSYYDSNLNKDNIYLDIAIAIAAFTGMQLSNLDDASALLTKFDKIFVNDKQISKDILTNIGDILDNGGTIYEILELLEKKYDITTEDLDYKTVYDNWENINKNDFTNQIDNIQNNLEHSTNTSNSFSEVSLSNEEKSILASAIISEGLGQVFELDDDYIIIYDERLNLSVVTIDNEIVDVKQFPKSFINSLVSKKYKNKSNSPNIDEILNKNTYDVTQNEVLEILTYLAYENISINNKENINDFINKLESEYGLVSQVKVGLINEMQTLLEPYNEDTTLMGENYRAKKMDTMANSSESAITRDYLTYCNDLFDTSQSIFIIDNWDKENLNEVNKKMKIFEENKKNSIEKLFTLNLSYKFYPNYK